MAIVGNKITTDWWPGGGSFGPIAKEPAWGADGNVKMGNTFAETNQPW